MKAKRVLAILLSLAVLVGIMPVGGLVLSGFAASTDAEVKVYDIGYEGSVAAELASVEHWGLGVYNQHSLGVTEAMREKYAAEGGATYTLSFEYYIEAYDTAFNYVGGNEEVALDYKDVAGVCTVGSGTKSLQPGRGSFELTVKGTGASAHYQIVPRFVNTSTDRIYYVYVWDLKVVSEGVELETYHDQDANYLTDPCDSNTLDYYINTSAEIIDSPYVTEIDFTDAQLKYGPKLYSVYASMVPSDVRSAIQDGTKAAEYTVSFDYYLPTDIAVAFGSIDGNFTGQSDALTYGKLGSYKHTFTPGSANNYQFAPMLQAASAGKLYIWNWKVELCGRVIAKSGGFTGDAYTTGAVTKKLQEYTWGIQADGSVAEKEVYVSADGSDDNDGSEATPFATLDKAYAVIAADTDYVAGRINVSGTVVPSTSPAIENTKPVVIEGVADTTATIDVSAKDIWTTYANTTLENIAITGKSDGTRICANQNDLSVGEGVTLSPSNVQIVTGSGWSSAYDKASADAVDVAVDSGTYSLLQIGHHGHHKSTDRYHGAANVTINGGTVTKLQVGSTGLSWHPDLKGSTNYQGDINVVVNGGTVGSAQIGDNAYIENGASTLGGHAVTMIFNNGTGATLSATPALADAEALGGTLYLLKAFAANGSSIQPGDAAGTFMVTGDRVAIVKQNGEEITRSVNGEFTVAPGVYDVEWTKLPGTMSIYVDDAGDDATANGTSLLPYKTLDAARAAAELSEYENTEIVVMSTLTISSSTDYPTAAKQYLNPVVIRGANTSSTMTVSSDYYHFNGPTTFQGINLNVNSTHLLLDNQDITIGSDVVFGSNQPHIHFGDYHRVSQADIYNPSVMNVTLSAGAYSGLVLANMVPHGGVGTAMKIPGINFVANNITATHVRVGAREGWGDISNAGGSDYQGDVNVVINGGKVDAVYVGDTTSIKKASTFNGHNIQIVLNDGAGSALSAKPAATDAAAYNGVLYFLNVAKADGCSIQLTDTVGTYQVVGERAAIVKVDGEEVARSENGVLTLDPGAYEIEWTKAAGTMSVYVDDLGDDETGDGSYDAPFKTLQKAFTVTETSDVETTEIVVKDSYTTTNQYDMGASGVNYRAETTLYKVPVIIRGETAAATFTVNASYFQFYGAVTFKNIQLNFNASANILLNDQDVTIGEGVVLGANKPNIYFGDYNRTTQENIYTPSVMRVNISTGAYDQINLSNMVPHGGSTVPIGRKIPGIYFVANDITSNYVTLGGRQGWGDGANGGSDYQGDVTVLINGGAISNFAIADVSSIASSGLSNFNGNTVTVILNNGAGSDLATKPTLADAEKLNGVLYFLNVAKAPGAYIEKTDTDGTYTVVGGRDAIAYDEAGNEVARSANGLLTLQPGAYEIGWAPISGTRTVYVDDAGSDETGDGSYDAPFKTFRKALTVTEQDIYERQEIVIKTSYTTTNEFEFTSDGTKDTRWTTKYNNRVVIRGASPEVVLNFDTKRVHFYGPVTLESVTLKTYVSEPTTFLADSRDVTFGDGITYLNQSYTAGQNLCRPNIYAGDYNHTSQTDVYSTDRVNFATNGDFFNVVIANMVPHGSVADAMKLPGVTYTMNGGSMYVLRVGGMDGFGDISNAGGTSFQGDVNIVLNGGHIGGNNNGGIYIGDSGSILKASNLNGHNVQIIFNNGTYIGEKDHMPTQADVTAMGGQGLYIIRTVAKDGYGLELTDTAGCYKVTGGAVARAVNLETGEVYQSYEDGLLYVDPGEWRVTFNTTLGELEQPASTDGNVFVGWTDANGDLYPEGTLWAENMTLTPKYNTGNFANNIEASLREPSNVDKVALRYELSYDKTLIADIPEENVMFGAVLIPEVMMGADDQLVIGGTYTYKNKVYKAASVDAKKILAKSDDSTTYYSINLTGINTWSYKKPYAIRGYMKFKNANGVDVVVYSDEMKSVNLYKTAEALRDAAGEAEKATFNTLLAKSDEKVFGSEVTNDNKPIPSSVNTATMYDKHTSIMDTEAENLRQNILFETESTVTSTSVGTGGTVYYISYNGNDNNDGLTSATALKTTLKLQQKYDFKSGDVVLFERGGVYRDVTLEFNGRYVSVGAYGSGEKPQLYAGDKNYIDATWTLTDTPNVWKVAVTHVQNALNSDYITDIDDIGNIVFDYGNALASQGKKLELAELAQNYDFYYDAATKSLYLYFALGNPAEYHNSIEICPNEPIIFYRGALSASASGVSTATVENLTLKYSGGHGVSTGKANNVNVRGCEIGYMGGSMLNYEGDTDVDGDGKVENVRYGNGIELFAPVTGGLIESNWIYQCYDAGYTNQGGSTDKPLVHKDLTVQNNLIEYCLYNIEVWAAQDTGESAPQLQNVKYQNNILRFAGYGFGTYNRIGSSTVVAGNISFYTYNISCDSSTVITGNVFDGSYRYLVTIVNPNVAGKGPSITGNTWVQSSFYRAPGALDNLGAKAAVGRGEYYTDENGDHILVNGLATFPLYGCDTLDEMVESVRLMDTNPSGVYLDGVQATL